LENKKFFLPITKGLIERSARLLSISSRPSRKNWFPDKVRLAPLPGGPLKVHLYRVDQALVII